MRMSSIQALILVCVFAAPCAAQQQQGGSNAMLGGSVGLGKSSPDLCDGCHTGIVIGLHGGAAVTSRLAIQAEGLFMSVAPNVLRPRQMPNGSFTLRKITIASSCSRVAC